MWSKGNILKVMWNNAQGKWNKVDKEEQKSKAYRKLMVLILNKPSIHKQRRRSTENKTY